MAIGCALVVGISQIPFVGPAAGLLIAVIGTGASVISWRDARKMATGLTDAHGVRTA